jgi:hypothetical protein
VNDPGLFGGDLADRVAEKFGVVEPDRCDHADSGVEHVRGVPGAAEPDFDGGHVDGCVGERRERQRGRELEIRHPIDVVVEFRGGG